MFVTQEKYSTKEVIKITGLELYHLRYYDKLGLFTPSVQSGRYRRKKYSTLDVLVLQTIAALKNKGMPFIRIRKVIELLMEKHGIEKPFHSALDGRHNVRILTDGTESFYLCYNDKEIVEHLKDGGQYMLLDVSDMASDLKDKIRALNVYKRKKNEVRLKKAIS
ncbi:MAG: transcriptional regulator, MerR family, partial [uncultured bacterium]